MLATSAGADPGDCRAGNCDPPPLELSVQVRQWDADGWTLTSIGQAWAAGEGAVPNCTGTTQEGGVVSGYMVAEAPSTVSAIGVSSVVLPDAAISSGVYLLHCDFPSAAAR
jgi:hypothetical protein